MGQIRIQHLFSHIILLSVPSVNGNRTSLYLSLPTLMCLQRILLWCWWFRFRAFQQKSLISKKFWLIFWFSRCTRVYPSSVCTKEAFLKWLEIKHSNFGESIMIITFLWNTHHKSQQIINEDNYTMTVRKTPTVWVNFFTRITKKQTKAKPNQMIPCY